MRPPLDNEELHGCIRRLAKARDTPNRHNLYFALIRAQLALLVVDGEPHPVDRHADAPVFAVFSDWATLEAFSPEVQEHQVMSGTRIFPLLAECEASVLMINPGGKLGGELYRHEILTICEGIERLAR